MQDHRSPQDHHSPGGPPASPLSRLPRTWCPTLGPLRRAYTSFSDDLPSPEAPPGLGRRRMPAEPSGRYLLRPPRPSGPAPGSLRARGAAGSLFSCQQRGKMRCQIPDREQKTKVFGPGSSATVSPYPRQLPTVPPAWRRRCPGRPSRAGGPRPPRATPSPAAITRRISEGTLPP